jgi:PAS domain S-box-containing protein
MRASRCYKARSAMPSAYRSHAIAATGLAAAVALRWVLDPWLGAQYPLICLFAAVAIAAGVGGWQAALWVTVAGYLIARWMFIEPRGGFSMGPVEYGRLIAYGITASVIVGFSEAMRRAVRRAESARQAAEQEAARRTLAETRFRLAADAVNGVIYEYDFRTGSVLRTRGLHEVLGWRPHEVPPMLDWWESQMHPDDRDERQRVLRESVDAGRRRIVLRYRMRHKDGRWLHVEDRAVLVRGDDGRPAKLHGCVVDVTHLKQAEEQMRRLNEGLRDADRRKDEFVATLAHELRNPLAPIRNVVRILQARAPQKDELQWGHSVIERQVEHMSRLLEDLLDVGRIAQGKLELRRRLVPLADVIGAAVETCRPAIDAAGHTLHVEWPEAPLEIEADPVRLTQVFSHLLANAAKYTGRGGRIEIAAREEGAQAVVTVRDTGSGIAPDMLGRLFDMFSQPHPAAQRPQGGLGIGLSLVKGLVGLHGGGVEAASAGLQRGSEFTVRLPLPTLAMDDPRGPGTPGGAMVRLSRRVLVVDDNRDSADTLCTLLQVMGCEVEAAYDGEEALAVAARFKPDAALLDLGMPKLNGFEACERMRREPWGRSICIIAVTGWGQDEDRRRTKEAGFDAHLVKPADPGKLTELLASLSVRQPREVA